LLFCLFLNSCNFFLYLLVKKKVYLNKSTDLNLVLTNYIICGCIKYSVLQREIKFKNLDLLSLFTYRDNNTPFFSPIKLTAVILLILKLYTFNVVLNNHNQSVTYFLWWLLQFLCWSLLHKCMEILENHKHFKI
jgi:hypothetical protein